MADPVAQRFKRHGRGLLLGDHAARYSMEETFRVTDAIRWFERILHNVQRVGEYDHEVQSCMGYVARPPPILG